MGCDLRMGELEAGTRHQKWRTRNRTEAVVGRGLMAASWTASVGTGGKSRQAGNAEQSMERSDWASEQIHVV